MVATRAEEPAESNTYYAQGGIIYKGVDDTPDALAEDILRAGAGHSYPPAVRILAEEGPAAVEDVLIERAGVQFDRDADGALSLRAGRRPHAAAHPACGRSHRRGHRGVRWRARWPRTPRSRC